MNSDFDRNSGHLAGDRDPRGRFAPGNPGRPHGTRTRATRAAEALLEGEAEGLTRKAIELALDGDVQALRLCLDRIAPATKSRRVEFDLPEIVTATDVLRGLGAVLSAVASGDLTPDEGEILSKLLELKRRALETVGLESRVTALESEREHSR